MAESAYTPRILIAGATGFVGKRLLKELQTYSVVALQRHQSPPDELLDMLNIHWESCDLYSLLQAEQVCTKVDVAIYLVHSMLPSARLNQASFQDTDLIMADNFARACKHGNVKHIIYLGGIIPDEPQLSEHLKSRLEVEETLGSYGIPLTSLRAAMIVGPRGSSFEMMALLVKRLRAMIAPAWTSHQLQPIDVADVVSALVYVMKNPTGKNECWDLAGPEAISYKDLMYKTAKTMGKKLWILPVPLFTPRLSVLWIQLITGMSSHLIKPLVQSLKHDMLARPEKTLQIPSIPSRSLDETLQKALQAGVTTSVASVHQSISRKEKQIPSVVRSVQRLPLPSGKDATWVAQEYLRWLPSAFSHIVVESDKDTANFYVLHPRLTVLKLKLSLERSYTERPLFYIVGGLLAGSKNPTNARLEFRETLKKKYILAAIHDFSPSLPWYVYKYSQALTHLFVMKRFAKHLDKLSQNPTEPSNGLKSVSQTDLPESTVTDRTDRLVKIQLIRET